MKKNYFLLTLFFVFAVNVYSNSGKAVEKNSEESVTWMQEVVPTFTQVAAICSGETLAELPLISNNFINGTWAPALNNTATTSYTFTPAAGQNASIATMIIVVNQKPVLSFTANPFPICAGTSTILSANANNFTSTLSYGVNSIVTNAAAFGPAVTSPLSGILVNAPSNGCTAFAPGLFAGKIALIQRGTCAFAIKAQNAQDAGAIGVILYNNAAGVIVPGGVSSTVTIPVFGILQADGIALIAAMTAGELPVTLNPAPPLIYSWGNGSATQTTVSGILNVDTLFAVTVTNPATGCFTSNNVNAAVTQNIVPTFAQVAPICLGGTLAPLPTSSTNATPLVGSWAPALDPTTTTTYTFTPNPVAGQCLDRATMTIVVNSTSNATTFVNGVITATQTGATYQWVDCNNANAPISGATSQSYTPTANGSYAVIVSINGCLPVTSTCQAVTNLATDSFVNNLNIGLYPNPSTGKINLKLPKDLQIDIYNHLGQLVVSEKMVSGDNLLNIGDQASGIYLLKAKDGTNVSTIKIIKN